MTTDSKNKEVVNRHLQSQFVSCISLWTSAIIGYKFSCSLGLRAITFDKFHLNVEFGDNSLNYSPKL